MAYDCSAEEERLQKKLIPVNIVVCVLCLVAAISLFFAPLLTINLSGVKDALVEIVVQDDGSDDSAEGATFDFEAMFDSLDGEFSFTTVQIGQFAFSDDNSLVLFIDTFFIKTGVIENMIVPMVNEIMVQMLDVDTTGLDNLSALNAKFKAIGNAKSEDEFKTAIGDWVDELALLADVTIPPEDKEAMLDELAEYYNETVEVAGGFSLEKFICVLASDGMELEEPITDYTSFFMSILSEEGEGGSLAAEFDEAIKMLAKIVFGFVTFSAATWVVLFLFSLLHIFAQNKRFMMWYVKLFGFNPCLVFGVLPLTASGALSTLGGEMAVAGSIVSAITSLTWISGACYLLLWGISIFWAFPIKRKIRADRKN